MRQFHGGQIPARGKDAPAKSLAAVEVPAGLRPIGVDGAKGRGQIEGDTGAVAVLVHAAGSGVLDDEMPGDHIAGPQLDHQMTATAAAGAGGKIGVRNDAPPRQQGRCLANLS